MIRCRKCGAGRGSLEPIVEHLEDGTILQTVRCILCGARRSRAVVRHRALPRLGRAVAPPKTRRPCAVAGCNAWISPQNKSGFCVRCGHRMRVWQKRGGQTPPPFVQIAGVWIENPAQKESLACVSATRD
jgi:hypothetical protein